MTTDRHTRMSECFEDTLTPKALKYMIDLGPSLIYLPVMAYTLYKYPLIKYMNKYLLYSWGVESIL